MTTNNQTSRAIKFRIWDKKRGAWEKLFTLLDEDGFLYRECYSGVNPAFNQEDYVIQQFTGLLSKDGKEIYEGDIVDYRYDGMSEFEVERYGDLLVSPVFWDYERWRIKYSAASYAWHLMRVIGNIYENPDLCSKN